MLVEPFLGRLVVVRRHHQHGVGAGLLGVLATGSTASAVEFEPAPATTGHPALGLVDAPLHHLLVLLVRERRALARGADRDEAVGALGDLPLHQVTECLLVDRPVLNGVTSVVNDPRTLVLAAMAVLDPLVGAAPAAAVVKVR